MESPLSSVLQQKMTFRPDIAGLRAWAVRAVVLFHFNIPGG